MINFGSVNISQKTKVLMRKALNEDKIGQSEYIAEFEVKFAQFLGVKHCILTCNGTMADTIALAVLKHLNPQKKKVLAPALTFIAQINAIYYNQLEPIFYDADEKIEITDDLLCIFPVHSLGVPSNILRQKWDIPVIEDACEALGSKLNGKYCGAIGDMGTFSFFPSHTISMGEGGAIVTNNDGYAELARKLRNHGKINNNDFHHDVIGFNGKISTMQAVIGLGFLDELEKLMEKRHKHYLFLGGKEKSDEYIVPHGFSVFSNLRDGRRLDLKLKGIDTRNYFSSIPTQEKAYAYLGYKLGDFPKAEWIGEHGFYVPCHQNLTKKELKYIKQCLSE